jgi:hypothetical protein
MRFLTGGIVMGLIAVVAPPGPALASGYSLLSLINN